MKIRWTKNSVRFRITPSELAALERGESIREALGPPHVAGWRATIAPGANETSLSFEANELRLSLSEADGRRLAQPDREGVYFQREAKREAQREAARLQCRAAACSLVTCHNK